MLKTNAILFEFNNKRAMCILLSVQVSMVDTFAFILDSLSLTLSLSLHSFSNNEVSRPFPLRICSIEFLFLLFITLKSVFSSFSFFERLFNAYFTQLHAFRPPLNQRFQGFDRMTLVFHRPCL